MLAPSGINATASSTETVLMIRLRQSLEGGRAVKCSRGRLVTFVKPLESAMPSLH
jgi:hypothetical protein